jgi:hypothetical protein
MQLLPYNLSWKAGERHEMSWQPVSRPRRESVTRRIRVWSVRAHSHCKPSRAEKIRLGKQTYVMKWKHSHCTPNRAELNRTEPDRACSLADVWFYSPADDRFCCATGLTSGVRIACLIYIECKYIGLRSFNQCGAFKTGFVGTKWQNNIKVIYNSLSFIRHSIWPSHIISSLSVTH